MAVDQTMDPRPLAPGTARDPENLSTDEVRQGVTGFGVRYVLFISTAAALVALLAAWVLVGQ